MTREFVQLVDEQNEETGIMEKMEAHRRGVLHRAVSVMLFNSADELLLQQRARSKYHSPGRWTNTCCTHPRPGEEVREAAERRLQEEMGISCSLSHKFDLLYKASFDNGLIEYEYDQVFIGRSDDFPVPNTDEVFSWIYLSLPEIRQWLVKEPDAFTAWFPLLFEQVKLLV